MVPEGARKWCQKGRGIGARRGAELVPEGARTWCQKGRGIGARRGPEGARNGARRGPEMVPEQGFSVVFGGFKVHKVE